MRVKETAYDAGDDGGSSGKGNRCRQCIPAFRGRARGGEEITRKPDIKSPMVVESRSDEGSNPRPE